MPSPHLFTFAETHVRIVIIDDTPWFVAKDVCEILSLKNPTKAIQSLDSDERSNFKLGRQGVSNIINESGLYALIFKSRKQEARVFRKWVTNEVLPAIRQTGHYTHPASADEYITRSQYNDLRRLVWLISTKFHYKEAASHAAWRAVRNACNAPTASKIPASKYDNAVTTLEGLLNTTNEFSRHVAAAERRYFRSTFSLSNSQIEQLINSYNT